MSRMDTNATISARQETAPTDGSMRTGRTTVDLGGENFTFYFETSGGDRGAGVTGEQDNRYYQSGKLLSAGTDERFQVVQRTRTGTDPDNEGLFTATHFWMM